VNFLTKKKFSFIVPDFDPEAFAVVSFHGTEELSRLYEFEIMLVTDDPELDIGTILQSTASFTIHRDEGGDVDFHGVVSSMEEINYSKGCFFYRVWLVPKLWWLSLIHYNQVFLNQQVPEIMHTVIEDGGLLHNNVEFRLQNTYQSKEFVCQYGETHFDFISRWMEHEGIYYFFGQSDDGDKVIFTDTLLAHQDSIHGGSVQYSPISGLESFQKNEIVQKFQFRTTSLPRTVQLRDHNYQKPTADLFGNADVDHKGRGEMFLYGQHFTTPEEGTRLAEIRAQELLCGKKIYSGKSSVPYLHPGEYFTLQNHIKASFNQKYLIQSVRHHGSQTGYLLSGIKEALSEMEGRVSYENSFTCIPGEVQFRPKRNVKQPLISGTLHGKIDAAGEGNYAQIDEQGRYKVKLPFDLSGRDQGKASAWLRLLQPYAGPECGMHLPLHKDTEVILSFIEGNPDRPVIMGAVPNPNTPSPVTSADQTKSKITTAGGNTIHIEDEEGKQRILLTSPTANTWVRLGAPNDPTSMGAGGGSDDESDDDSDSDDRKEPEEEPEEYEEPEEHEESELTDEDKENFKLNMEEKTGYSISTSGNLKVMAGAGKMELVIGSEAAMIGGDKFRLVFGAEEKIVLGALKSKMFLGLILIIFKIGRGLEFEQFKHELGVVTMEIGGEEVELKAHDMKITGGNITVEGDKTRVTGGTTEISGDNTQIIGDNATINGNNTIVATDHTEVTGQGSRVTGDGVECFGDNARVTGDATVVSGDETVVSGDNTLVTSDDTEISGDEVMVNGNLNTIQAAYLQI